MNKVVVVGGGLAGLAMSGLLANAGYSVTVVEAREDPAQQTRNAFRSINLALSARGIRTLEALGLDQEVIRSSVPVYGRRVHFADGREDFHPYDLIGNKAIYSIRRSQLWQFIYQAAQSNGAAIIFDARCAGVDCDAHTIRIADHSGRKSQLAYDALIGSDGTHSAVRRALVDSGFTAEETSAVRHGYLELHINEEYATGLDRHALHIWPRGDHMLVALPNADGSFTATLFLPLDGDWDKDLLEARHALNSVVRQKFPDAVHLLDDFPDALAEKPLSPLFTSKCRPWSNGNSVVLIGDAAHTMTPFYGQGMNCALEDCWVLMRSVERMAGEWPRVFADFEQNRHLDADAITFLSEANYDEMSRQVTQREFKRRREIEQALQIRFPQSFVPLYALIAFSTVPYAQALARGTTQAAIVDHLLDALNRIEDLDLETEWLKNALDAASSSGERSSDEFSPASDQGCEMTKMQG